MHYIIIHLSGHSMNRLHHTSSKIVSFGVCAVWLFVVWSICIWIASPSYAATYRLTVKPEPEGARVRIMNIPQKYEDGISLEAREYDIEVSKDGYRTYRELITLSEDTILSIKLEKVGKWDLTPEKIRIYTKGIFGVGAIMYFDINIMNLFHLII